MDVVVVGFSVGVIKEILSLLLLSPSFLGSKLFGSFVRGCASFSSRCLSGRYPLPPSADGLLSLTPEQLAEPVEPLAGFGESEGPQHRRGDPQTSGEQPINQNHAPNLLLHQGAEHPSDEGFFRSPA